MPYISSETVKLMRNKIKKSYPGFKFSITRRDAMAVCVVVLQGNIDFKDIVTKINGGFTRTAYDSNGKKMIADIEVIIDGVEPEKEITFDGDYGSIPNYYTDIAIGDYERPYKFMEG